jgi:hypothetical protein
LADGEGKGCGASLAQEAFACGLCGWSEQGQLLRMNRGLPEGRSSRAHLEADCVGRGECRDMKENA